MAVDFEDKEALVAIALQNKNVRDEIVEMLAGPSRKNRQNASVILHQIALSDIKAIAPYSAAIADALNRPEAQTRWECLEIMILLLDEESRLCDKALGGAEMGLFDEGSSVLRLTAMRFLCKYGATTPTRSKKVWPLIDEAVQCYHGDLEFMDMLQAVTAFSKGSLAPEVKEALRARMDFDAKNSKGSLKRRAQEIIDNLS